MSKVDEMRHLVQIDPDNLDQSVIEQPVYYFMIAEAFVEAASERDAAEEALKEVEARLNIDLRVELEDAGYKVTEGLVASHVRTHSDRVEASEHYLAKKHEAAQLQELKHGMEQRAHMLRELGKLWVTNYYDDGEVKTPGTMQHYQEHFNDNARARMSEKRREKSGGRKKTG